MIKVMVGNAGTSPERTSSAEAARTEFTNRRNHRRFNRAPGVYGRAIAPELPEPQLPGTEIQPGLQEDRVPGRKNRPVLLLSSLAVLIIAAAVTFAVAYFRDRQMTAADATASVQGIPARTVRLGMRARQQGRDLLLSWDEKSQAVQSATDGLLQIDDGAQHREIALDRSGIQGCSMLYTPTSDDVVFRLEIRGKEGVRGAESLEVVGTGTHTADLQVPPASAPAPEVKPEPNRPNADKLLSDVLAANRRGSKKVNTPNPASQRVSRRPAKPVDATARGSRPVTQTLAAEKAPPLSMATVAAAQPSAFSGQQLPKPPPQPSASAAKSPSQPAETVGSAATPSSSTNGMNSGTASYVPPRPVKWTAPNAKSLGLKIASATDVQIKVRIDDSGRVTSAHALLDGSPHDEALANAVAGAVKQWVFEPAKMHGKNVPSEETVVIRIGPRE
jgi:hypothetical protein